MLPSMPILVCVGPMLLTLSLSLPPHSRYFPSLSAGNWVEDRVHGNGEHVYANGNRYSGDWVDGKITGYGVLTFADGETYEGELKDGRMQGRGTVSRRCCRACWCR
jgi:hypothetical protein